MNKTNRRRPRRRPHRNVMKIDGADPGADQKTTPQKSQKLTNKNKKTVVEQMKHNKNGEGTERRRPPGADPQKRAHLAKGICT